MKCKSCGNTISKYDKVCPYCGADPEKKETISNAPKSIEELKIWYDERHLPSEKVTRFFIGKNYQGKRAFGIYQDQVTGHYVVYKNKDNGERSIRYEGDDEAYAVNELYMRLKKEIQNQKMNQRRGVRSRKSTKKEVAVILASIGAIIGLTTGVVLIIDHFTPDRGYYHYNNSEYYYLNDWYYYDTILDDWYIADSVDSVLKDNYRDYYDSDAYAYDADYTDFEDTSYYDTWLEDQNSSDNDSDYDWGGSDSWDSGSTDWGSDW